MKTKPFRVVIEDLNIKGIMKNKHLSKAIQEQCLYEFSRQIEYKCKFYGIEVVKADRFQVKQNLFKLWEYKKGFKA